MSLCPDGTCVEASDGCEGREESPCPYDCAPVACQKVDNSYAACQALYQGYWHAETTCGEAEYEDEAHLYTFTEPGFIVCYVWFGAVPLLLFVWCFYNQRISSVLPESCQTLDLGSPKGQLSDTTESTTVNEEDRTIKDDVSNQQEDRRIAWQTGYKFHPVGFMMYFLTFTTISGVYFLLIWLIIQYYIQQGAIRWWWVTGRFDDEIQVLLCFILVWMYGFVFVFSLKFPHSIQSIHLRRCNIFDADYIAIAVQRINVSEAEVTFSTDYMRGLKTFFSRFYGCVHVILTFIFSDKSFFGCERKGDATFVVRPVHIDKDGTKYIIFEFRRYNLNNATKSATKIALKYVPGVWKMPNTNGDFLSLDDNEGLSENEVEKRRRVVGHNRIEMENPSFLREFKRELSTPFYTYQIFMVFSWTPLWYYYVSFSDGET